MYDLADSSHWLHFPYISAIPGKKGQKVAHNFRLTTNDKFCNENYLAFIICKLHASWFPPVLLPKITGEILINFHSLGLPRTQFIHVA